MLAALQPAVVNIRSVDGTRGSGFPVHPDGYFLTAFHVIDGIDTVLISFGQEPYSEATVVATDREADLAILKIETEVALAAFEIDHPAEPRLGEWLVVLGNPFGQGLTVSVGITGTEPGALVGPGQEKLFQTDAAINPGNSGGPVLAADGRVVGIATARIALGSSVGFVTPIEYGTDLLGSVVDSD